MNPIKLYRILQEHTGKINALVVKLYNDEIKPEDALSTAKKETAALTTKLKDQG